MDLLTKMDKNEIKEFFSKNWLTHDAMWYGSSMHLIGPEKTNQLNKGAVRLMAGIEIKRILNLMGKPKGYKVKHYADLSEIIETAFEIVQTSFMKFDFSFPEENLLRGRFEYCFAYEGVKKFGLIDDYDCGIVERVKGWLDALGVSYTATTFKGCLMHQCGECIIDIRFKTI